MPELKFRVSFVTLVLAHYRKRFHELAREFLASRDIDYSLVYSEPISGYFSKRDVVDLPWAKKVNAYPIPTGFGPVYWQSAMKAAARSNLVIIGQENRLLFNYWAHLMRYCGNKTAYFGHGRNFQGHHGSLAERFKDFMTTRVDWWFAYTEQTRQIVAARGFPVERVTVINNAIDTSEIQRLSDEMDDAYLSGVRSRLAISSRCVGVFVGRLYDLKRVDFLIDAAKEIKRQLPDFTLVIVGGGEKESLVSAAAAAHNWIVYQGPKFGRDVVEIMRIGRVFMMPGAVGLSILDCAATATPIVTTNCPFHGPEIAYLKDGLSGIIVNDWLNVRAYADAVAAVLSDDAIYQRLANGSRELAKQYTIEKMADNFSNGVVKALAVPNLRERDAA